MSMVINRRHAQLSLKLFTRQARLGSNRSWLQYSWGVDLSSKKFNGRMIVLLPILTALTNVVGDLRRASKDSKGGL